MVRIKTIRCERCGSIMVRYYIRKRDGNRYIFAPAGFVCPVCGATVSDESKGRIEG